MKLHAIAEKLVPIIAAVLLMLSHTKNVMGHLRTFDLQEVITHTNK